jgi:hypothetical protein
MQVQLIAKQRSWIIFIIYLKYDNKLLAQVACIVNVVHNLKP